MIKWIKKLFKKEKPSLNKKVLSIYLTNDVLKAKSFNDLISKIKSFTKKYKIDEYKIIPHEVCTALCSGFDMGPYDMIEVCAIIYQFETEAKK